MQMWPNPQCLADLVTFTKEILNGKLHRCAVSEAYSEVKHLSSEGFVKKANF